MSNQTRKNGSITQVLVTLLWSKSSHAIIELINIVKAPHLLPLLKMNYLKFFRCHYLIRNLNTINVVGNVGICTYMGVPLKCFLKTLCTRCSLVET